jgi:predicted AlkP superfamily phosphohydrolase/phosphomutase
MKTHSRIAALFLVLTMGLSLVGCSGSDTLKPEQRKLLIIGIDSADWQLLNPLLDEGRLPNMAAFREQSASGGMETFVPLTKSPILWASISTGVAPEMHGIGGFVKGADQDPITGLDWQAPAIWDIAGAADLSSAVIGMWTTYPAREINGAVVSDFLPYGHGREAPLEGLVSPAAYTEEILAARVDPQDIPLADLAHFLPESMLEHAQAAYPEIVEKLKTIYAADLSYVNAARLLAAKQDYDLFYFYQRGPDMISHLFWAYMEPDKSRRDLSTEEVAIFGQVVPRYYDYSDEVMGEVLSWFPADRQTVVLSDHGFFGPRKSGKKGAAEHSKYGIFLIRSPLYEPGSRFDSLPLYDVCPTMLATLNLPASKEMPGLVMQDCLTGFGKRVAEKLEAGRIDSYQALSPDQDFTGEKDEVVNEEIRRQLKSLGYIN